MWRASPFPMHIPGTLCEHRASSSDVIPTIPCKQVLVPISQMRNGSLGEVYHLSQAGDSGD